MDKYATIFHNVRCATLARFQNRKFESLMNLLAHDWVPSSRTSTMAELEEEDLAKRGHYGAQFSLWPVKCAINSLDKKELISQV